MGTLAGNGFITYQGMKYSTGGYTINMKRTDITVSKSKLWKDTSFPYIPSLILNLEQPSSLFIFQQRSYFFNNCFTKTRKTRNINKIIFCNHEDFYCYVKKSSLQERHSEKHQQENRAAWFTTENKNVIPLSELIN